MLEKSLFFRFTISGDELDLEEIMKCVSLPCEVYKKGEVIKFQIPTIQISPQKTNRWVFSSNTSGSVKTGSFLTQNLLLIKSQLQALKPYIKKFNSDILLTIYTEGIAYITLSKTQITLLNEIGAKFSVRFC